jgi:hypothetical protein
MLLIFTAGCMTYNVHDQSLPGVDFSGFKTFAQKPPPARAANIPGYSTIMGDHIQSAIAHELESKGFRPAAEGSADLVVAFSVDGQPRQDIQSTGGGWYGGWGDTYSVQYVEGTVTIDIFDARKRKLIWHAYGQTRLFGSSKADKANQKVDAVVAAILKKFPPEKK